MVRQSDPWGIPVDEQWVCPKCGFTNEYYAAYCVSCSELRPREQAESPIPEEPTTRSDHQPDAMYPSATDEPRRPAQDYAPRPTTPVPVPTPPSSGKRPFGLPRNLGKTRGLVILVIVVAIVIPAIRSALSSVSNTETTQQSESTYQTVIEVGDLADLAGIDTARSELLNAYQTKSQAWREGGQGGFPSAEYLVVDELLAFQGQVTATNTPDSEAVRALYVTWTASLSRLLLAEQALAREPNQANLDARTQAWADEAIAYGPLWDGYLRDL